MAQHVGGGAVGVYRGAQHHYSVGVVVGHVGNRMHIAAGGADGDQVGEPHYGHGRQYQPQRHFQRQGHQAQRRVARFLASHGCPPPSSAADGEVTIANRRPFRSGRVWPAGLFLRESIPLSQGHQKAHGQQGRRQFAH